MSRNLYFDRVLDEMARVHDRKNEDYADDGNPFSNFEGAAAGSGLTVDQVFLCILNIKTERLRQLVSGKSANYESMDDSILDIANYAGIWLAWRLKQSDERVAEWERLTVSNVGLTADLADIIEAEGERRAAEADYNGPIDDALYGPEWTHSVELPADATIIERVQAAAEAKDLPENRPLYDWVALAEADYNGPIDDALWEAHLEDHPYPEEDHHVYPEEEIPHGTVPPLSHTKPATVEPWRPGKNSEGKAILGPGAPPADDPWDSVAYKGGAEITE